MFQTPFDESRLIKKAEPEDEPFNSDDEHFFLTDDEYDGDPFASDDESRPKGKGKRNAEESGSETEPEFIKRISITDAEAVLVPVVQGFPYPDTEEEAAAQQSLRSNNRPLNIQDQLCQSIQQDLSVGTRNRIDGEFNTAISSHDQVRQVIQHRS